MALSRVRIDALSPFGRGASAPLARIIEREVSPGPERQSDAELLQDRRVTELNQQLVLAKAHTEETRARVDQLRKASASDAIDSPSAPETTVLSALRQDYAKLTRQAAEKEAVLGARHPDIAVLQAQIADTKKQIAAEQERLIGGAKNDYLEARQREAGLGDFGRHVRIITGSSGGMLGTGYYVVHRVEMAPAEAGVPSA